MQLHHDVLPVSDEVTQDMINTYAEVSGDFNPLHVDPAFASRSEFGGTIAHGPIALQTIFNSVVRALDTDSLPAGTRIAVTYRAPVKAGDRVTSVPGAVEVVEDGVSVSISARNQNEVTVISADITLPRA